jgi:hypothetical protein
MHFYLGLHFSFGQPANAHAPVTCQGLHVTIKMASSGTWIHQTIRSIISELDSIREDSVVSRQCAEALEWRIELVYRDMIAKEVSGELDRAEQEALPLIARAYSGLREFVESSELLSTQTVQPTQLLDGFVGRPRYEISD